VFGVGYEQMFFCSGNADIQKSPLFFLWQQLVVSDRVVGNILLSTPGKNTKSNSNPFAACIVIKELHDHLCFAYSFFLDECNFIKKAAIVVVPLLSKCFTCF